MRSMRFGLLLCASLALVGTSFAQPKTVPHARARLVSSVSAFKPGVPFTVAIVFDIDPGWHLYYKDPGDAGMPPEVQWSLPAGLKAGELQFPKPEVLKNEAGIDFVYHGQLVLLVEMTPDETFQLGRSVEIEGRVSWLECDVNQCLPAKQTVSLALNAEERATEHQAEQFKAWRDKIKEGESFDPAAARKQ